MSQPSHPAPLRWKAFLPRLASAWNSFFFSPVDLRTIGILRIAYTLILLVNVLAWYPDLTLWFGEEGVMPAATLEAARGTSLRPGAWSVWEFLPHTDRALFLGYYCFVSQIVLLMLGYLPRLQAVSVYVWLISFQHRNTLIWDGEDTLMRLVGFFLLFMPLEKIWAWDWRLRPSHRLNTLTCGSEAIRCAPCWSLRLLQIQICCIYLATVYAKLRGNAWWDGTALYFASRLDDFFRPDAVPNFLFDTPWTVRWMTWMVLVIELAVPILIWFRETRRTALLLALVFHITCNWSMNLFLFHWIMLCGWLAFLATEDWKFVTRRWRNSRVENGNEAKPLVTRSTSDDGAD